MPSFGTGMGGGQIDPRQLMLLQLLLGGGGMGGVNPATGQPNGMGMGLLGMGQQPQGLNQVPSPQQALMGQILNPQPTTMQQVIAAIRQMQGGGQPQMGLQQPAMGQPSMGWQQPAMGQPSMGWQRNDARQLPQPGNALMGGNPMQQQMLMQAMQTSNQPGGGMPPRMAY